MYKKHYEKISGNRYIMDFVPLEIRYLVINVVDKYICSYFQLHISKRISVKRITEVNDKAETYDVIPKSCRFKVWFYAHKRITRFIMILFKCKKNLEVSFSSFVFSLTVWTCKGHNSFIPINVFSIHFTILPIFHNK